MWDLVVVVPDHCLFFTFQRRFYFTFYFTFTKEKNFMLRLIYAYHTATVIMLRPLCWSRADGALMLPFEPLLYKSVTNPGLAAVKCKSSIKVVICGKYINMNKITKSLTNLSEI